MVWMGEFCFAMIGSLLRELILHKTTFSEQLIGGFKTAAGFLKWLPAVFRDGFLAIQPAKMAAVCRIFAGRWVLSPLECIERFSIHFNGLFIFALRCFRLMVIFLEWIVAVKRDTTVTWKRKKLINVIYLPHIWQATGFFWCFRNRYSLKFCN